MKIRSATSSISVDFGEELLRLFARQARRMPLPVFLVGLVLATLAMRHMSAVLPVAWLCLLLLTLIARRYVFARLADMRSVPVQRRLTIAVALTAANGVVFSLSLGFFGALSDFERTVQTTLFIAMCSGSVGTTAGYLPVFLAYLVPTLSPLALLWAWQGAESGEPWIGVVMALLVPLLSLVLVALGRDAFRLFKESFDIRLEKDALNAMLLGALARAEAADRAKTRFLASASHDLRQPLHTLSIFAAALSLRPLDERSRAIIGHMNEALSNLSSELDALLDISKLDAGLVTCRASDFGACAFLERVCQPFFNVAVEKGLQARLICPDDLQIQTDQHLLERVLRNLLENACKYTEAGSVTVSLEAGQHMLRLTVGDSGPGIAESEHDRIFEEFYQVGNRERDRVQGLGLGLAIVRRLLDLLEIGLELDSTPGVGSRFTMLLPRALGQAARPGAAPTGSLPDLAGLYLLVIDDEAAVRLAMTELMSGQGCRVSAVDCTQAALDCAAGDPPDMVLADLRLRGDEDGIAAVQALRERQPGLPALLISGDTAPQRLQDASAAGIRLLHKPVPAGFLLSEIAVLTGRSAGHEAPAAAPT